MRGRTATLHRLAVGAKKVATQENFRKSTSKGITAVDNAIMAS
jgi:hypothetical protein